MIRLCMAWLLFSFSQNYFAWSFLKILIWKTDFAERSFHSLVCFPHGCKCWSWTDLLGARNLPPSPTWCRGPRTGPLSSAFPGQKQRAELKVEWLGHELVLARMGSQCHREEGQLDIVRCACPKLLKCIGVSWVCFSLLWEFSWLIFFILSPQFHFNIS